MPMLNSLLRFVKRFDRARVRTIEDKDLSREDNIIALMGPTGTGKSSFIEKVTGKTGLAGHSLESFTDQISIIRFELPEIVDSDICFVDTPGFDDTHGSDLKTVQAISKFLTDAQKKQLKLTGLLYFHRISDNRMSGSLVKVQRYFEELCDHQYGKIAIITTMWDLTDQATAEQHERQLTNDYWSPMLDNGASRKRFLYDPASAFTILAPYFDRINAKFSTCLQEEVRVITGKLGHRADGQRLSAELRSAIDHRQVMLQRIRIELRHPSLQEAGVLKLMSDYEELFRKLSHIATRLETMGIETGQLRYFRRVVCRMNWDGAISIMTPIGTTAPRFSLVPKLGKAPPEHEEERTDRVCDTKIIEQEVVAESSEVMKSNKPSDSVRVSINQPPIVTEEETHSDEPLSDRESEATDSRSSSEAEDVTEGKFARIDSRSESDSDSERSSVTIPSCVFALAAVNLHSHDVVYRINFNRDPDEADQPGPSDSDDELSVEDQEDVDLGTEEDEPMQEQESYICGSTFIQTSQCKVAAVCSTESETWEEFEMWKEETERREYERWWEGRKRYEDFERVAAHDDRDQWVEDDGNHDEWCLFKQWQDNEQRKEFNWFQTMQEKDWGLEWD